MGQKQSQSRKPLEVIRIQYLCSLIKIKLTEYKRSREAALAQKENPSQPRNQSNEIHQLSAIIEDYLNKNAAETIIRKIDVVKEYALTISQSQGRLQMINDLTPFIENICWSNMIFGMECITSFKDDFVAFFGVELEMLISTSNNIDDRVRRALAPAIIASYDDLNGYVNQFCQKYSMTIEQFNDQIHSFVYLENSNNSLGNNSNLNIYSANCTTASMSNNMGHYSNGFMPTNHYENQILASNRLQNCLVKNTETKKSKLLFCY